MIGSVSEGRNMNMINEHPSVTLEHILTIDFFNLSKVYNDMTSAGFITPLALLSSFVFDVCDFDLSFFDFLSFFPCSSVFDRMSSGVSFEDFDFFLLLSFFAKKSSKLESAIVSYILMSVNKN